MATRWYERHGARLPGAVSVILVILIAWMLSQLIWALIPVPETARWQPAPVVKSAAASTASRGNPVEGLISAQLFGSYQAVPTTAALGSAPDTNLNLLLIGILAGSNEADSRALIAQQGGDEAPYAIGADIVSGVTLHAIFPDRVILARNGTFETLRLDKDSPSRASGNPVQAEGEAMGIDPMAPAGAMLGQIRDRILQDPGKASEYIRVQPSNVNGSLKGYRLYPGRSAEAFSHLGLRPGDLVTAVNGIQLNDGQKALQTLNELKQAGSVTLTLERGGQVQTISVSLN